MLSRIQFDRIARRAFAFLRIAAPLAAFCGAPILYELANIDGWSPTIADFLRTIALVGYGAFPLGAYFVVDGCYNLFRAWSAARWPTARGLVISSGASTSYGGYGTFWHVPRISYRYEVGGVPFEGNFIQSARMVFASQSEAAAIGATYPVSAEVAVRYDPLNPDSAVLDLGHQASRREILIGIWALSAPIFVGVFITWLNSLG